MAQTSVAAKRESRWAVDPDYHIEFEPSPRRVRVGLGGETVADSSRMMLMHEGGHLPVYYFPRADVRMALLRRTDHGTHCPYKGDASYWTVEAGGRVAENGVWSYEDPYPEVAAIKDHMAFYWDRMDHWYEEDEEVFVHARDPRKRVDAVESRRPVRVVIGGETIAETTRAQFLFETGLPTRYYMPPEDVRMDLLAPSDSTSRCPYKGIARYWSAGIDGRTYDDVVWSYPDPIAECPRIKGYLCFFNERVDDIFVDGEAVPKVRTKWSHD